MSLENRSSSALFKRAEQLKRWQESETNREDIVPKRKTKKIQFSSGVVFLAACAAGDKDEVLRLLRNGADIDTANVDGLTALHQLCIDDNLDMVEFLVENGADVNRGDNEGWTPLHATASCGFVSIAKYLIEHGGNVAAVNNDAELPVDLAETDEMEELLRKILLERGIDCDEARNEEQQMMLADAKEWLNGGLCKDSPHPKTGATALHVAAAKGYMKVISVLLQAGADVNIQDFDGWTPLHAAAHWCQKEVCELLVKNFCDMDIKNCVGQAAFDVADAEMVPVLEELRSKQATMQRDRNDNNAILHKKGISSQKRRMSGADKSNLINKDASSERQLFVDQGTNKVRTVELEIEGSPSEREDTSKIGVNEIDKRNLANRDDISRIPLNSDLSRTVPTTPLTVPLGNEDAPNTGWKRPGSFRNRGPNGREEITNKTTSRIGEKDTSHKGTTQTGTNIRGTGDPSDVVLRRTQSFEDEGRSREEDSSIGAKDTPSTTTSTANTVVTTTTTSTTSPSATSPLPNSQVRRSFVPPVRDEESETQRKAHAKRVRETRRSTQGVTLEEIKTAEQLVKKKNQQLQANQNTNTNSTSSDQSVVLIPTTSTTTVTNSMPSVTATATITTGTPTAPTSPKDEEGHVQERRPSWRLRVDNGDRNKFLLEDARSRSSVNEVPTTTTSYIRRPPPLHLPARPASAPIEPASPSPDTTVTVALRRQTKPPDDKDQDKENDIRNAQATQAVIQRRRRPKRRSTGIPVDVDDADSERQDSLAGGDSDGASLRDRESGGDWSGTSRLSNSPGGDSQLDSQNYGSNSSRSSKEVNENGEIDYKKLYEASVVENERLRDKLKKTEDDLVEARNQTDKHPVASSKNSLSEMEKRERRAMERKLSEMEEELKQLQKLKAENERLKAENRALTRVVSKLTNSAHATK